MVTNRRLLTKDQDDFFPTPEWCTEALFSVETFDGSIWEPACGDGAIVKVVQKYMNIGEPLIATDLNDHGYGIAGVDFLKSNIRVDNIITNPPYNIANEFTEHALDCASKKVALLVRLAFLEGQDRFNTIFDVTPPARVWVFSERITMYKKYAEDKSGSGTTAYAWVVWDSEHTTETELRWIKPGFKPKEKKNGRR